VVNLVWRRAALEVANRAHSDCASTLVLPQLRLAGAWPQITGKWMVSNSTRPEWANAGMWYFGARIAPRKFTYTRALSDPSFAQQLILQPHLVISQSLSLAVAVAGTFLIRRRAIVASGGCCSSRGSRPGVAVIARGLRRLPGRAGAAIRGLDGRPRQRGTAGQRRGCRHSP
jgi:hypothetical protein